MNSSQPMDQQVNTSETYAPVELDAEALKQVAGGRKGSPETLAEDTSNPGGAIAY